MAAHFFKQTRRISVTALAVIKSHPGDVKIDNVQTHPKINSDVGI